MKKFYSFVALMLLMIMGASAQVTSLEGLSNSKAYTIASQRCFFQNVEGTAALVTSTGSVEGVVTEADAANPNQQFAILKGDNDYYLYSVGAQKFINSDGSYVDVPGQETPVTVEIGSDADYPFMLSYSGNYINTQESGSGYENGYVINSWSTADAGNQFKVVEAADADLAAAVAAIDAYEHNAITVTVRYSLCMDGQEAASYETTTKGAAPLTVTFDAPKTFLGATCADETRADEVANEAKTIDVVYNYALNQDELPFVPATITDGAFAQGTKWYYINPEKKATYSYYAATANSGNGGINMDKNMTSAPADCKYFFAFTGNPLAGFEIRNYNAGAAKGATGDASDPYDVTFTANPSQFAVQTGSSDGQYRFRFSAYDETGSGYLNSYYEPLYLYAWSYASGWAGYAATDDKSQYYIQEVSDEIYQLATGGQVSISSVDPEEGNVKSLSEITVTFDVPISRIYGFDSEGAGMDGEDEPKTITLVNANGETVLTFNFEDDANGYEISEENPNQLVIYSERPFTTEGEFSLVIPTGLVYSEIGLTNAEKVLVYNITGDFNPVTVTARVYNASFGSFSGAAWPSSLLPYDETLGYYTIKANVTSKDQVTFEDYTGKSGENLTVKFDTTDGSVLLVNGEEMDSYGSYWATSSVLDGEYSGYYLYYSPSYCNIDFNTEDGVGHGIAALNGYKYTGWTSYYQFIEFYLDDRFAAQSEVIKATAVTPAEGQVESLSTFTASFEYDLTEVSSDKVITLTDANGTDVGGTITYSLDPTDAKTIVITLSETVTADGLYTLTIPTGVAAREAEENAGYTEALTLTYRIGEEIPDTITWSKAAQDYLLTDLDEYTTNLFTEGGNFDNISVEYYGVSNRVIVRNFMGAEGKDLTLVLDANNNVLTINGEEPDSYGSVAVYTGNDSYYFAYIYADYITLNLDENNGSIEFDGYYYKDVNDDGSWCAYAIKWGEGGTDAISLVKVADKASASIYNLQGVKMNGKNLKAGIYLMNGKKVVIK